MLTGSDTIPSAYVLPKKCAHCGYYFHPQDTHCPQCGIAASHNEDPTTRPVGPMLSKSLRDQQDWIDFEQESTTTLELLSAEVSLIVELDKPVILGRKMLSASEDIIDLSECNAFQHGVSRHHCQLRRQGQFLIVTDLASSNGTLLNDQRLLPYKNYVVAHGDQLILGTLQLIVNFRATSA